MNGKLMLTLQGTPWSYQCKLKELEMRYFLDGHQSTGGGTATSLSKELMCARSYFLRSTMIPLS
jgi:hypothetical protein